MINPGTDFEVKKTNRAEISPLNVNIHILESQENQTYENIGIILAEYIDFKKKVEKTDITRIFYMF